MDGSVYPNKDAIKASKNAVLMYASKETSHGSGEVQQGKEKVTTCMAEFGVQCDDHVKLFQETSSKFFNGNIRMPTHILLNPDGSEIERKEGAMAAKEFAEFIAKGTTKVGFGLGGEEFNFVKSKIADGAAALEKQDLKGAIKVADEIKKNKALAKATAQLKKADDLLAKVNDAGQEMVKKALELVAADKADEAKKMLRQVSSECGSLECGKSAKEELAKLPK